ncbi:MAG: SOS response-associated peptidase [Candidatus Izemoplasmatales bacterium]
MCGRFTISKNKEVVESFLKDHFEIHDLKDIDLPRYNVSPGQPILAVIKVNNSYRAGLIPWDYKVKFQNKYKQVINARSETVDQLYSFKKAFKDQRCLVVSDGFYEWDKLSKQPYRILKKDESLYFYAGIYDHFTVDGKKLFGLTILTTEANELIKDHHHRMPVILDIEKAKTYISNDLSMDEIKSLLEPYPKESMLLYPVSKAVNSFQNDSVDLIKKTTTN